MLDWWGPILHEFYAGWSHYQTLTDRELPVVRLRPTSPAP